MLCLVFELIYLNTIHFLGLVFNSFLYCVSRYFDVTLNCSLEHGTTHSIHIPAVDNDDDLTKCGFSEYIEAGAFIQLVQNLTKTHIIRMNEKVLCILKYNFAQCALF